jgi:hypothetical protein
MTVRREIALEYIRTSDDPCTDRSGRFSYSAIRSLSPLLAVSSYSKLVLLKFPTEGHNVILR